ncbi:MAG: class I SAM-dependent methyltransferase [Pirellulales bacterium]
MNTQAAPTTPSVYDRRFVPLGFDLLIGAVFLPIGGVRRLRSQALDQLDLRPGLRVLELGCGTGGITRLLLARGAVVTAVDGSARMLQRAKRKAPGARYIESRLEQLDLTGPFDRVLFAFVLHELAAADRQRAITAARQLLAPEGMLAILDHAVPKRRGLAAVWRSFLLRLEPPTVSAIISAGYDGELAEQGVAVVRHSELAGGTAQLILARPIR